MAWGADAIVDEGTVRDRTAEYKGIRTKDLALGKPGKPIESRRYEADADAAANGAYVEAASEITTRAVIWPITSQRRVVDPAWRVKRPYMLRNDILNKDPRGPAVDVVVTEEQKRLLGYDGKSGVRYDERLDLRK